MPYEIAQVSGKFLVRKKTDKKRVFGTHPTYEKALAQLRAIEVNTHEHASLPVMVTVVDSPISTGNFPNMPTGRRVEVRPG